MVVLFLIDEVRMGIYIHGRNGSTYLVKSTRDLLNLPMTMNMRHDMCAPLHACIQKLMLLPRHASSRHWLINNLN